jgi:hypothetical protein
VDLVDNNKGNNNNNNNNNNNKVFLDPSLKGFVF